MSRLTVIFFTVLIATTLLTTSCVRDRVYMLTDDRFEATPEEVEVKLFLNKIRQPHRQIAYVESFSVVEPTEEDKRLQLQDLRKRGRKIGADAVMDVKQYNNIIKGMLDDPTTPFPSPTQGMQEPNFYRGIAIRYVDAEEAKKYADQQQTPEELRGTDLENPTSGVNRFEQPRGLAPLVF